MMPGRRGFLRHRQLDRAVGGEDDIFGFEEVQPAHGAGGVDHAGIVAQHQRPGPGVVGGAAIDLARLVERLAALELLDDERIAGLGHRPRAPLAGDEDGVLVDPGHFLLALGKRKAAVDERLGDGVEFAHDIGVLAAVGQHQEAAALVGREAVGALEHPIGLFRLGQRIDVEHRLPHRRLGAVAGHVRAAPQAADMGLVLPEIIEPVGADRDVGNAVLGLEDFERARFEGGDSAGPAGARRASWRFRRGPRRAACRPRSPRAR